MNIKAIRQELALLDEVAALSGLSRAKAAALIVETFTPVEHLNASRKKAKADRSPAPGGS